MGLFSNVNNWNPFDSGTTTSVKDLANNPMSWFGASALPVADEKLFGSGSLTGKIGDELFGDQTQKSESAPWSPAQPYMTGTAEHTGLLPESMRLYKSGENFFAPGSGASNVLANRIGDYNRPLLPGAEGFNNSLLSGGFDQSIGNLPGANSASVPGAFGGMGALDPSRSFQSLMTGQANGPQANVRGAFGSLGELDPSQSYKSLLSGQPNMQALGGMHQANIDRSLQGYGDAINQFNTQVLPSIRSGAQAAGQYGGSRQGIAEGLAMQGMQRNARDLSQAAMGYGNELYGNAYENAQGRMANTANTLGGFGMNAQGANMAAHENAQGRMANTAGLLGNFGMGAQNQNFENAYRTDAARLGQGQQNIDNRLNAFNSAGALEGLNQNRFTGIMGALRMPSDMRWGDFNNYANTVNAVGGAGGVNTQPNPNSRLAQGVGLLGAIGQIGGM